MAKGHDFERFPELTDSQMQFYYFESPHKQITESFKATVTRVIDGDTIQVKWVDRDFEFPVRFIETAAPESGEPGGKQSKEWLRELIEKREVEIIIDQHKRVGKYGRILGRILSGGLDVNNESVRAGKSVPFSEREEKVFPDFANTLQSWK
jgi:endonuclease YncB( thermonuclease family)